MTSVKKLTKKNLVELANELGISSQLSEKTDLKQDYVEKIEQYASSNPIAGPIITKHLDLFKSTRSPSKKSSINGAEVTNVDTSSDEEVEAEKDSEIITEKAFKLPFDLKSKASDLKEKVTDFYDESVEKVIDLYDDTLDYIVDASDAVRDFSSSPTTLAILQVLAEFVFLYYKYVEVTTVARTKSLPASVKTHLPKEILRLPALDYSKLFSFNAAAVFTTWSLITLIAPAIISYYINFTKTTKKGAYKYTFDPYIFALTKFLSILYVLKHEVSFGAIKEEVIYKTIGGSCIDAVWAFFLEGEVQLRLFFGNTTLVASGVASIIALYAVMGK